MNADPTAGRFADRQSDFAHTTRAFVRRTPTLLALDVLKYALNQIGNRLYRCACFFQWKQQEGVAVLRVRSQNPERFAERGRMPGSNENRGQNVARILPVDTVPGKNLIFKMNDAWTMYHDGIGMGCQIRHTRQIRAYSTAHTTP